MNSNDIELRDLEEARRFVLQGLWLQRVLFPPHGDHVGLALEWALEIASGGDPLPPVGFVADLGIVAFNLDRGERRPRSDAAVPSPWPSVLGRTYEDHVLGKIYGDWTFAEAGDALRRYEKGRNWARGLAFLIRQFRKRAQFVGVLLPPSILRTLMDQSAEDTLQQGRELMQKDGFMPLLEQCYQSLVAAARRTPEVLLEADVAALHNGIALAEEGQRLAHELVIRSSSELLIALPEYKVRPLVGRQEVPTRVLDEDTYPVGGFAAIATRGSIESLLHSQLAYMEMAVRPDLFDLKFLRDELYYYSRDENQFLRRRRAFVFALFPDLVRARFKDPELSTQRIVLLLGLLRAAYLRLCHWLSSDALQFDFLLVRQGSETPLDHEHQLLGLLFGKQIANQSVTVSVVPTEDAIVSHCRQRASRSECHCLTISMRDEALEMDDVVVTRMSLANAMPAIAHGYDFEVEAMPDWASALERLLQIWV